MSLKPYIPTGINKIGGYVTADARISANLNFSAPSSAAGGVHSLMTVSGPSLRFNIYIIPVVITTSITLRATASSSVNSTGTMTGGSPLTPASPSP